MRRGKCRYGATGLTTRWGRVAAASAPSRSRSRVPSPASCGHPSLQARVNHDRWASKLTRTLKVFRRLRRFLLTVKCFSRLSFLDYRVCSLIYATD